MYQNKKIESIEILQFLINTNKFNVNRKMNDSLFMLLRAQQVI